MTKTGWLLCPDPTCAASFRSTLALAQHRGHQHPTPIVLDVHDRHPIPVAWHADLGPLDLYERLVAAGIRPLVASFLVEERGTAGASWRISQTLDRQEKTG